MTEKISSANCPLPSAYYPAHALSLFPIPRSANFGAAVANAAGALQVTSCAAVKTSAGEMFVEPSQTLTGEMLAALQPFGVKLVKKIDDPVGETALQQVASCWPQLLPLEKCDFDDRDVAKTILFKVNSSAKFTALASEMLRLGNDRIGYRPIAVEQPKLPRAC